MAERLRGSVIHFALASKFNRNECKNRSMKIELQLESDFITLEILKLSSRYAFHWHFTILNAFTICKSMEIQFQKCIFDTVFWFSLQISSDFHIHEHKNTSNCSYDDHCFNWTPNTTIHPALFLRGLFLWILILQNEMRTKLH